MQLHKLWDVLIQGLGLLNHAGFVNIMTTLTFSEYHRSAAVAQNMLFDIDPYGFVQ